MKRPKSIVTPFVDGPAAFRAMVAAIRTAADERHSVYIAGWTLKLDFPLIEGDDDTKLLTLLKTASLRGVEIRAMLWDQPLTGNSSEVNQITENLKHGFAILDNHTRNFGSHHQKMLIVNGTDGLICFCGGMDIHPVNLMIYDKEPQHHDVHCEIRGPAAYDILKTFVDRWRSHPGIAKLPSQKRDLRAATVRPPSSVDDGIGVSIKRTYPRGGFGSGLNPGYRFAPNGEFEIWKQLKSDLQTAEHFVYIEEQYLVCMEMSRLLQSAVRRLKHLIILLTDDSILQENSSELPQVSYRRQEFIKPLRKAAGDRLIIACASTDPSRFVKGPGTYVHSKAWIIDDRIAVIGSANVTRRSYTHDSELNAHIRDDEFAKRLRLQLWSQHLGLSINDVTDLDGAAAHWKKPPKSARVAVYNERQKAEWFRSDGEWNTKWDPEGSDGQIMPKL